MTLTPEQAAAFKAGTGGIAGGYVPDDFALLFALIAAAVAILWAANMIRLLAGEALAGRTTLRRALIYKVRVIVLLLLLVALLH
jgi:hypothetical protein